MSKRPIKAFPYFGGKYNVLKELYSNMPTDVKHFVDVFGGSMTVALNYPNKSAAITACDINEDIINFYTVLRTRETELVRALRLTPCAEQEFKQAWEGMRSDCPLERARCFFIRSVMGFYGLGSQQTRKGKSISFSKGTSANKCKGRVEVVSRLNNKTELLTEVAQIIRERVQIVSSSYEKTLVQFDYPTSFFYVDPPYNPKSRSASGEYKHEFTECDHRAMAERLNQVEAKAMISGYRSDLMIELYEANGWHATKLKHRKYSAITRKELPEAKQEWIWTNYNPALYRPKPKAQKKLSFTT